MPIVSQIDRALKWRFLDKLEALLTILCAFNLALFTVATLISVITRTANHPILWIDELILGAFVWGIFLGASVAVRRNQHFRIAAFVDGLSMYWRLVFETFIQCVVIACAVCISVFGYVNFLQGFGNYLETTGTPIAVITASVPVFGGLTIIFSLERLINTWRLMLSKDHLEDGHEGRYSLADDEGAI